MNPRHAIRDRSAQAWVGSQWLRRMPAVLLALCLAGCYPDLDWREVGSKEGGFAVLLPARAEEASRPISSGITLRMWTAKAGSSVFGAGYADYPDAAAAHFDEIRDGLARNIAGRVIEDRSLTEGEFSVRSIRIEGSANGRGALLVHARLLARAGRLHQLAVISEPGVLSEADLDMFFRSFKRKDS